jgi:ligand-binding SRPBCC domain-containing protein
MYYELTDHFTVTADIEKTWAFFSVADNLPLITPPQLGFSIKTPLPIAMGQDTLLDYTIRWMGIPVNWWTRIIDWTPPNQFIDLQIRGPYTLWHHQHRFVPGDGGTTTCSDRVIYKLPGGPIGAVTHSIMVRQQLIEIFRFRREAISKLLGEIRRERYLNRIFACGPE